MPTIGLDYTPAYEQGAGIGRYVRELVRGLADVDNTTEYRLFVSGVRTSSALPAPPGANFTWHSTSLSPAWMARLWHRAHLPIPVERWTGRLDVYHATDFVLPPTRPKTATLLTVHDLSFVRVPEATSSALKRYLDRVVPRSVQRADLILADSCATREDLIALYDAPANKVRVLYSGVNEQFRPIQDHDQLLAVRQKYNLGGWPFLFTIGTVQPRKNYVRLCEAFAASLPQHPDLHLVIAGGKGWLDDPIYAAVKRLYIEQRVHFVGYATDADLPALYSAAVAVPYVSLYEGFGLPVLEAMACGTPVIASNTSSIPEVAGDAAILVNPQDSAAIASAIDQLLIDSTLYQELVARGIRQAARFTWHQAANQLVGIYSAVSGV